VTVNGRIKSLSVTREGLNAEVEPGWRSLAGRGAVVTGAGGGIGCGVAAQLVRAGARVVIADVDSDAAEATAHELGDAAVPAVVDVADPGSVERLKAGAIAALGSIYVLVNNAGVLSAAPVLELSVEEWDRVMGVNARGVFLCSKAFGAHMVEQGGGCIINVASISGKQGDPTLAHYSASKFAVVGFTQALAKELAPHNVSVNAVCPGTVRTPMMGKLAEEWGGTIDSVAADLQLVKRPQDPLEIGAAVVFLASMESITGQAINVDGGCVFN
jgi:meso-butanediol dehydrogenase / (S,S)-butanediol dehydrogenase / diacetyl reductase